MPQHVVPALMAVALVGAQSYLAQAQLKKDAKRKRKLINTSVKIKGEQLRLRSSILERQERHQQRVTQANIRSAQASAGLVTERAAGANTSVFTAQSQATRQEQRLADLRESTNLAGQEIEVAAALSQPDVPGIGTMIAQGALGIGAEALTGAAVDPDRGPKKWSDPFSWS